MRCLLGFAEPAGGRIELFGEALDAGNVWSMRQRIAWVPQEPELGAGTAREAIEAPFRLRANRGHKPGGERTAALAERLQLDAGVLDQEVTDLSGGEKQRVALMIALLLDRPLLLLDEVTSAMDGERRDVVLACLRELEDTAIVSVSHDPERFHVGGAVLSLDGREGANGSG
jgi:ABC-type iron transport system FetAB ATPase subunit